jgi:hypothetical protein
MNKVLFGLAAGVACLVVAGEADAAVVVKQRTVVVGRPYYQSYGVRHGSSYHFSGRHHRHWGHRTWDSRHRRYHYYEPSLRVYFYYDNVRGGYYPCH